MNRKRKSESNRMQLCLPALSVNESVARAAVAVFCAQRTLQAGELSDIKCALSEAVTNCTVHAYPDKIGPIRLSIKLREDRTIVISVKDKGVGIADTKKAREPLFTTDAANERSGMGFTVMEGFSDSVKLTSTPGKGTTVTLTRKLAGKSSY